MSAFARIERAYQKIQKEDLDVESARDVDEEAHRGQKGRTATIEKAVLTVACGLFGLTVWMLVRSQTSVPMNVDCGTEWQH